MSVTFNGERLRLARLLKGLSLQEVGESIDATRQSIHQYESGSRKPPDDVKEKLATALAVEPKFFELNMLGEVKFEQCHFRKRKTTPVAVANRVLAYSTILEQLVELLHHYLDLPENSFELLDSDSMPPLSPAFIETLAEGTRERWGIRADAPIGNMIDVAENAGALVTYYADVSDKVDALSVNRKHPLIIRNTAKHSLCRMRFDIAHECGHLIMHSGIETGCKKTEQEADTFASAFLFPRRAFAREFPKCIKSGTILWEEVYKLKLRWKVSARAIIYRAHYLGFIDSDLYRKANIWFSRTRQTRGERYDDDMPLEEPNLLKSAVGVLNDEVGISFEALAKELGVEPETLADVTGLHYERRTDVFEQVVVPFKFGSAS